MARCFVIMSALFIASLLLCSPVARAESLLDIPPKDAPNLLPDDFYNLIARNSARQDKNNLLDIDPKRFKDFWKKWDLVTIRYKLDTNQMRFVYANPIAAKALKQANKRYFPEGSVLAKLVAGGAHDPLFDTSVVPDKVYRVQLMLRDSHNPKAHDGWVYALYEPGRTGNLLPQEIENCNACHQAAKSRDFVFSEYFSWFRGGVVAASPYSETPTLGGIATERKKFHAIKIDELPSAVQNWVRQTSPSNVSHIMYYERKSMYDGAYTVSTDVAARLALNDKAVYLTALGNKGGYLVYEPELSRPECVGLYQIGYPDSDQPVNVTSKVLKCFNKYGYLTNGDGEP